MTETEFNQWLVEDVKLHGTQTKAARIYGISTPYLGDILHGRREPGKKLLNAIGFEKIVSYEKREMPT